MSVKDKSMSKQEKCMDWANIHSSLEALYVPDNDLLRKLYTYSNLSDLDLSKLIEGVQIRMSITLYVHLNEKINHEFDEDDNTSEKEFIMTLREQTRARG